MKKCVITVHIYIYKPIKIQCIAKSRQTDILAYMHYSNLVTRSSEPTYTDYTNPFTLITQTHKHVCITQTHIQCITKAHLHILHKPTNTNYKNLLRLTTYMDYITRFEDYTNPLTQITQIHLNVSHKPINMDYNTLLTRITPSGYYC